MLLPINYIPFLTLLIAASTSVDASLSERVEEYVLATLAENGPCVGRGGAPGVCISTQSCSNGGGTYISNKCPGTPENIKCCVKTACGTGNKGNCRFTSNCDSGKTETGKCPGPTDFKCCMPKGTGYPRPKLPSSSSGCKSVAINGAKKILDAFEGKVKRVDCIRECKDPSSSDHCTGMATDIMVADGGVKTTAGEPIAEWVMHHRKELSLKYVMWGQKIWDARSDKVKPWSQWDYQACTVIPNCKNGDRGSNTRNHWDHVHVSYR
ncbi:hypothetical protein H2198_002034 [Neophaeococcomyces mojaviensis]|uniref:Uncharacterized protein n=1 Tax=Neophaeococcomyces mojaviensis TaxID=3383035 RepID=A0ACC3AFR6_9EURO|nr:hypothetical protein H2198_002034 [Knufia sp. JES_112]